LRGKCGKGNDEDGGKGNSGRRMIAVLLQKGKGADMIGTGVRKEGNRN